MSTLYSSCQNRVYKIQKWRGLNESEDGDTNLDAGEGAIVRNFRVTDGGALQVRPGSLDIAGLTLGYTLSYADETSFLVEKNISEYEAETYASASLTSAGNIQMNGESMELTYDSSEDNEDRYIPKDSTSAYKFTHCVYTDASAIGGTHVDGGSVIINSSKKFIIKSDIAYYADNIRVRNGAVELVDQHEHQDNAVYLAANDGNMYKIAASARGVEFPPGDYIACQRIYFNGDDTYTWYAEPVSVIPNTQSDTEVRGLWSGRVGNTDVMVAACNGHLWKLEEENGVWSKTEIGQVDTSGHVGIFGYSDKLYILDGEEYRVYDGTTMATVSGYVPCVAIGCLPAGGGTEYESVNKLTAKRWQQFSGDGSSKDYKLLEEDIVSVDSVKINGEETEAYSVDLEKGTVTFDVAPAESINNVYIYYTAGGDNRSEITAMRYSEFYNGQTDSRVFLYGDGSNKTYYSGITLDGEGTAEYFPDLNEIRLGDSNTPITALIRHYNRLLAFKLDSTYSIYYGQIDNSLGVIIPGFYISAVNRTVGNEAYGQAVLVENRPRTLDGRSIYEWKSTSTSGNITGDQRNANRISQRIENTLKSFALKDSVCFFDKLKHEYYCVYNGTAVVNNTENDTWYVYTNFPACAFINYKDELYYATPDGWLRHFSRNYRNDNSQPIDAYWESGSLSFDRDYIRKYSLMVWIGMKPETGAAITVGVETDNSEKETEYLEPSFTGSKPRMNRLRMKASKFTYYKLSFSLNSNEKTATIVSADIDARFTTIVR